MKFRIIKAKHFTACRGCGADVIKGEQVKWASGRGVFHIPCDPDLSEDRETASRPTESSSRSRLRRSEWGLLRFGHG